jgi:hypothetical protein
MKQRANLRSPLFFQYDCKPPTPTVTNYFLRSNEIGASPNTNQSTITVSNNVVVSPDDSLNAESVVSNTDSSTPKYTQQTISLPSIGEWTFSVYVKYDGASDVSILAATNAPPYTNWLRATFNCLNGTATTDLGDARIEDATNGWYRLIVSGSNVATGNNLFRVRMNDNTPSGEGFFVWGGQVEQGTVAHQLVPTTSSSETEYGNVFHFDDTAVATVKIWSGSGGYNKPRTNIIRASNDFKNSQWFISTGVSTEENATIDPFGESNAHRFTSTIGANGLNIFGGWQTTERCISIYAKKDTTDTIQLRNGTDASHQVTFDLSKGVVTSEGGNAKGHIREVGSGWYRVSMTHAGTGSQTFNFRTLSDNESIFIYGAQVEEGSQATTYIPTILSGETVDAYTSDIPSEATYTLTKDPINHKSTFEVSQLVRDYIDQNKYANTGAVWLDIKIVDIYQLPKHYRVLCTEGYTDNTEPLQTHLSTPSNPVLMQTNSTVIRTSNDMTLSIPVYAQEGATYTLTNTSGTESTQRPIGDSDLSDQQIDYLQVEDDTANVKLYVDSVLIREINIQDSECSKFDKNVLFFVNKFGAKQSFAVDMMSKESISAKDYGYSRNVINYNTLSIEDGVHAYRRRVLDTTESYTLNTPFLDEENSKVFEELILSEYVWLIKPNGLFLPVTVKDTRMNRKTHVNDKLIQYTIKVDSADNLINNQR